MRLYVQVTGAVFAFGAVAQLTRAVLALPLNIAGFAVPVWSSVVAFVAGAAMAAWAYRLTKASRA
ncbi:MAG: hypothetical protein FJ363_08485 [Gemmatimonadetes bacterium]|nr:hypothetical protein [Gemmatimonadota bacterium]